MKSSVIVAQIVGILLAATGILFSQPVIPAKWAQSGHSGKALVAVTPDGKYLATANRDEYDMIKLNQICLWDAVTGSCLRVFNYDYLSPEKTLTYSYKLYITPDHKYIIIGNGDFDVWNVETNGFQTQFDFASNPWGYMSCCTLFSDSKRIAGHNDTGLIIRDVETGERLKVLPVFTNGSILGLAFNTDESCFIAGFETYGGSMPDACIVTIRIEDGVILRRIDVPLTAVSEVDVSSDKKYAIIGGYRKDNGHSVAHVYNLETGALYREFDCDLYDWLKFVPNSTKVICSRLGAKGSEAYDYSTGQYLGPVKNMKNYMAFSPDGKYIYSSGEFTGNRIAVDGSGTVPFFGGFAKLKKFVLAGGDSIIALSYDQAREWYVPYVLDLKSGKSLGVWNGGETGIIPVSEFNRSKSGRFTAISRNNHVKTTAELFDSESDMPVATISNATTLGISTDEKSWYVAREGMSSEYLLKYDIETGVLKDSLWGDEIPLFRMQSTADGKIVMFTMKYYNTQTWYGPSWVNMYNLEMHFTLYSTSSRSTVISAINPVKNEYCEINGVGNPVVKRVPIDSTSVFPKLLWNEATSFAIDTGQIWDAVYTPDGRYLLVSSIDTSIYMYDLATEKHIYTFKHEHFYPLEIAVTPDMKNVLAADYHNSVLMCFDMPEEVLAVNKPNDPSPDGVKIASVYPNPAVSDLTVSLYSPTVTSAKMELVDLLGRVQAVKEERLPQYYSSYTFKTSELQTGTYLLRVSGKDFKTTRLIQVIR